MRATLLLLVLAGCPLATTHTSTIGGGTSTNTTPATNDPDATVKVPKILGMTKDQADAALAAAGFTHGVDMYPMSCDDPKPSPGTIECQDPAPGQSVKANAMIKISVLAEAKAHTSMWPEDFASLEGLAVDKAMARAKHLGFTGSIETRASSEFIEGCKPATVCKAFGDSYFEGRMTLVTNKTLSIAPPPD